MKEVAALEEEVEVAEQIHWEMMQNYCIQTDNPMGPAKAT